MLFLDLLTYTRRVVLAEDGVPTGFDGGWKDDELYNHLYEASAIINAELKLVTKVQTSQAAEPCGDRFIAPFDLMELYSSEVFVNGNRLRQVRHAEVIRRQHYMPRSHSPRVFSWQAGDNFIHIAPRLITTQYSDMPVGFNPCDSNPGYPSSTTPMSGSIKYTALVNTSLLTPTVLPWLGQYAHWHHVIALRAGIAAWESVDEYARGSWWAQRYNQALQAFSAELGKTNLVNLIVPQEAREDRGAVRS